MKRWTKILKVLANYSRLSIVKFLADGKERTVSEIAREIHVTFRGTSRHLNLLYGLGILKNEGKMGHVFYSVNSNMPKNAKRVIDLILKSRV
jgi:DNA-binding transcriptional ArsR family regulator